MDQNQIAIAYPSPADVAYSRGATVRIIGRHTHPTLEAGHFGCRRVGKCGAP